MMEIQEKKFVPAATGQAMMTSRQEQEVQAAMIVAKRFPRDVDTSWEKIKNECKQIEIASDAEYVYPKGGTIVSGPNIRLAEVLARNWGNLDFAVTEVGSKDGTSEMMAYCVDLESNVRSAKMFTVKHSRYTRQGSYPLNDPREIYEATANFAMRRLRACILSMIPAWVQARALEECNKTLAASYKDPLGERLKRVEAALQKEFGVNPQQIKAFLGHALADGTEKDFLRLKGVFTALRDNIAAPGDYFPGAKRTNKNDPFKKTPPAAPPQTAASSPPPPQEIKTKAATKPSSPEEKQEKPDKELKELRQKLKEAIYFVGEDAVKILKGQCVEVETATKEQCQALLLQIDNLALS